jgi:omega-6 fatty acid desaturase (delta-12 desaturase)
MSAVAPLPCGDRQSALADWKAAIRAWQKPSLARSAWQIANTVGSYLLVWCLLDLALGISWWLVVPLAVLGGGLMVRTFIIFHDCGHGSMFRSARANAVWGFVCGVLTFTPYHRWRWEHARHHAHSGNLDQRGIGDIWTLTVAEYQAAPRWRQLSYRLVRNPLVMFLVGPLYLMLVQERTPSTRGHKREKRSVWWMNLAVLAMVVAMASVFGLLPYLLIQFIILAVAGTCGVWLFYIQHQYEDAYWARSKEWNYFDAALEGSSYYQLPRVLQWFSGNIGFHHIHHLNPCIPNYYLERCHHASAFMQAVPPITLRTGFKSVSLRLWDESAQKLVSLRELPLALNSVS